ncbi:sensor histidine kinase [Pseudobdellovibrio exovorus]|uniref:histidine kinase n=1 Tax=Pseudobdellovibrio exovorus JSS TaxID=1184267 RepID=M4V6P6_9BACT|nr:sensor histidine kinase KdpD [Pseudobdellovibrio exovorus]AGH94878.1 two-component sensor KdpD [Pseudobdellovibrio exovorus JSS]
MTDESRLDPDALLKVIDDEAKLRSQGKLRVFLGMSAGVGKTYAMLKAAHRAQSEGHSVLVGVVETHGRSETAELLTGLEILPRKIIQHRGIDLEELDLDAILIKKPDIVIVDELPHSNVPGSRHEKRYQDVLEILRAGIDVFTALNVQHLESRKDAVESITGIRIRETVPDSILDQATLVEVVDIAPSELLKRLADGKVYLKDKATEAAAKFFKEDKLTALREIALRMTAERVDQDLQRFSVKRNDSPWQTNERLLVAVSHSPYSEKLLRATRRLAYNLESPWIAVHIDTGIKLSDEDQAQLVKNLHLARELSAEVITTTDTSIASAIKRIARQKNVTQVVVGRPTRRWFRDVIEGGSLLSRLVNESHDVDVHVIRMENLKHRRPSFWAELALYRTKTGIIKYWNTLCFLVGVTFFSALFQDYIGYRAIGFIFLLAVLIVGMFGSIGAVLFAAAFSALFWDFLFIAPRFTFTIASPEDIILCISYFAVALITGFLTNRIRFQEKLMREREERMEVLYRILKDISESYDKKEFIQKVRARVGQLFDGECGVLLKAKESVLDFSNSDEYPLPLNDKERAVALWTFQNQKAAGWSTETLSQAQALYLPLNGMNETVGVFVFRPEKKIRKFGLDQETLLYTIVGQLGFSIERHFLRKRIIEAQRVEDSEKLQQTILASISHELRTPLTAILGSAAALDSDLISNPLAKDIVKDIEFNSERLNRVIENLLDMSRLSSGSLALNLEWQDISDLIGVVLKKHAKPLQSHRVEVGLQSELPLVRMDFRLFEHALANLILNAAQYSQPDTKIIIRAYTHEKQLVLEVKDHGAGIPVEFIGQIFEKFYRVPGTLPGGTGLGLSIVKNIVELHRGTILYHKNEPQGSRFIIYLPLEPQPTLPIEENA